MADVDLKETSDSLLSTTTVSFQTAAATNLYTVPTGKRCILTKVIVICGSDASTTVKFTVGSSGSTAASFLAEVTGTNLAAQYDALICVPIPATTALKSKSYAAADVIQFTVSTADVDGSTDAIVKLYGTIY